MAAIGLGGFVILSAATLITTLRQTSSRVAQRITGLDAAGIGERQLRAALRMMEVPRRGDKPMYADAEGVVFRSWCTMPGGWLERCSIELSLVPSADSTQLFLSENEGPATLVRRIGGRARLVWTDTDAGVPVVKPEWRDADRTPVALVLAAREDTAVYLVRSP
jgi:hypothetical protein